jgi:hypothetical protein
MFGSPVGLHIVILARVCQSCVVILWLYILCSMIQTFRHHQDSLTASHNIGFGSGYFLLKYYLLSKWFWPAVICFQPVLNRTNSRDLTLIARREVHTSPFSTFFNVLEQSYIVVYMPKISAQTDTI